MLVPGEIQVKNIYGRVFTARISAARDMYGNLEYLYDPVAKALQYRVVIPGVELSFVVLDITLKQLRKYLRTGKPVLFRPIDDTGSANGNKKRS